MFINESLYNSTGTNRAQLGAYKKFSMNLTNVVLPQLIAPELVMVKPMSSFTGYVTYLKFTTGSKKGNVNQGDLINGVFALGDQRNLQTYTSSKVEKNSLTVPTTADSKKTFVLDWSPVVAGSFLMEGTYDGSTHYYFDANGIVYETTTKPSTTTVMGSDGMITTTVTGDTSNAVGTIDYGKVAANPMGNYQPPVGYAVTPSTAAATVVISDATEVTFLGNAATVNLSYVYNNEFVPQNDIPVINMKLDGIPLVAHARRIAIYYSQIAAFQAKTDYEMNMQGQLAEKAVAELSYKHFVALAA